ncbi:hypothetical protein MRX96_028843 [Rhipicephalus microplus]
MLYTAVLERELIGSGLAFALLFQYGGSPLVWTLPGLVFVDDLVLLPENTDQPQNLIDISAHHLASLKLMFNAKKLVVLRFSGPAGERELVLLNGQPIPRSTEYRYLGQPAASTAPLLPSIAERKKRESCGNSATLMAEQSFLVGESRSCSCVADNSGVVQQYNRRSQQKG